MKHILNKLSILLLLLLMVATTQAQQNRKFHVQSFEQNQFDTSARVKATEKYDGNGDRYSIIKVTSTNPNDDLMAYSFDFGMMNSLVEQHDDELWVYVQRNAKHVTISRAGYVTIRDYDLRTTIQPGQVFDMVLSPEAAKIQKQMVYFKITPIDAHATIMYKRNTPGSVEEMLGVVDENGELAENVVVGNYTYRVVSKEYYGVEGMLVLDNPSETKEEEIVLRPKFAIITLSTDATSEIYIDGELKGTGTWSGRLNKGAYNIECSKVNHKNSFETIIVEDGVNKEYVLSQPIPIVGSLSLKSTPMKARISIDGKEYGTTPRNLNDLLIGHHKLTLSKSGYATTTVDIIIKENEITEIERTLTSLVVPASKKEQPASEKKPKKESKKSAEPKAANSDIPKAVQPKSPGYFKKHDLYLQAGIGVGGMTPLSVALGCHLWNVNLEIFAAKGLAKETLWANNILEYTSEEHAFTAVTYGAKLGYGIKLGKRIRLTPQVGIAEMELHEEGKMLRGTSYIMGALKGEYALTKNIGITVMPEYLYNIAGISFYDYDNLIRDQLEYELFRDWSDGFTFTVGLFFKL